MSRPCQITETTGLRMPNSPLVCQIAQQLDVFLILPPAPPRTGLLLQLMDVA